MTRRTTPLAALALATLIPVLAACGAAASPAEPEAALTAAEKIDLLGGQEDYDRFMALYEEAVDAGETSVTIYGPEAEAQTAAIRDVWGQYFPEISITGVQINGASLAERAAAEATTGQGSGDVVISGSADILTVQDQLGLFDPFSGDEIDDTHRGPQGTVASALMPFAFVYNPGAVAEEDLPGTWSDLLTDQWQGVLSVPDPTNPGAQFHALNTMLYDGVWSEADVATLAASDPTVVPGTNINGPLTNVAQGQSDGAFFVTTTTIREAVNSGAPVAMLFPMDEDNVLIPEYLGVLASAPSPIAAELYGNWRLTRAGADAVAKYGFYSLVDGAAAPDGMPPLADVDIMPEVPFDELLPSYGQSMPLLREYFAG